MKEKKKTNFKKAKTPDMLKKQKGAIINYYIKKRENENIKKKK
ncbi:MAG: hypothetical protein R3Y13_06025 [bacterium]